MKKTKSKLSPKTSLPTKHRARPKGPVGNRHESSVALTPLARTLREPPARRVTPLDAFTLARRKWAAGERLDIGQIASELGVGRATVFRWVGSRDQLYGEVLSAAYARVHVRSRQEGVGRGAALVADIGRRTLETLWASPALRTFIEQDPEFALRILTSKSSPVQERCVQLDAKMLRELADKGEIQPALDVDALAYIIVRIAESFLYGDVISGREPNFDAVAAAVRILVSATPEAKPEPRTACAKK